MTIKLSVNQSPLNPLLRPRSTLLFFHCLVLWRLLDKTSIDQIVGHVYNAAF